MQLFGAQGLFNTLVPSAVMASPENSAFFPLPSLPLLSDSGPQFAPQTLRLTAPPRMPLADGLLLKGEVTAQEGSAVTLQVGDETLQTQTGLPLSVGQRLNVQVQGQPDGGWSLQVVGSQITTSPLTEDDLASTLQDLGLAADEPAVGLAKALVEFDLPLSTANFQQMSQTLAELPTAPTEGDRMAACFLKAGDLPVVAQNITTLANFIAEHPLIGMQLFSVQQAFRRLAEQRSDDMPQELGDMAGVLPALLGELILDAGGRNNMRKMTAGLRRQAFQSGIENLGPHAGDDFDMKEWLQSLRDMLRVCPDADGQMGRSASLLDALIDNLAAQRLLNAAVVAEQGSYYWQIPMQNGEVTTEARLFYHVDSQGTPRVDADNITLELLIPTKNCGPIAYRVQVQDGEVSLDAASDNAVVRGFLQRRLAGLVENIAKIGYHVSDSTCSTRGGRGLQPIVRKELQSMERVDVQA